MSDTSKHPSPEPDRTATRLAGDGTSLSTTGLGLGGDPFGPAPQIGPYRLIEQIGEGGMGQVWLAEQTEPVKRRVALKLVRAGRFDSALLGRFEAERQALAIMEHPAIAKVFDAGTAPDGQPYFVMEYVEGLPITKYCDQKHLSLEARLALFMQVCEGVQHAHLKAIIHRDIKPSNVMVTEIDGKPSPRIIDFGIAKAAGEGARDATWATNAGDVIGTLGYMSPEQADPRIADIDTRTDVYALGVILFELLTGSRPFEVHRAPLDEVLRRLREDDPPALVTAVTRSGDSAQAAAARGGVDLGRLTGMLRGDLDSIARKALARDRDRRYATPLALAADLQRYLQNLPVEARPASTVYLVRKHMRRHRFGIAAGAVVLMLLVGFAIAQTVQLRRITRERDRADRIASFMTGMFEDVDPVKSRARTITAREVLDAGARRIAAEKTLDPLVRARLMVTMGHTYTQMTLAEPSEKMLGPAVELLTANLGPDARETLRARALRGRSLHVADRHNEAAKELAAVLARQTALFGAEDADTLTTTSYYAEVLATTGKPVEAEKLFRAAIAGCTKLYGPESTDVLTARRGLANALQQQNRYADSLAEAQAVLEIEKRVLGPENYGTLYTMQRIGYALSRLQRFPEAEKVDREVYETSMRVLGPDHDNTLVALGSLIDAVRQQEGRVDEAIKLSYELLAMTARARPAESESIGDAEEIVALALGTAGRGKESAPHLEKALEIRRRVLGPESPGVQTATQNLAFTWSYAGEHEKADPFYREAIRIAGKLERVNGVSDAWLGYAMGAAMARKTDLAFDCLRKSLAAGYGFIGQIEALDDLKPLQMDPRWAPLVAEIKAKAPAAPPKP